MESSQWSEHERAAAKDILAKLEAATRAGQNLPTDVFEAHLRTFKKIATELIVFDTEGRVFLIERPSREENPLEPFPSALHSPGVIHRASEIASDALKRLKKDEIGPDAQIREPVFVGIEEVHLAVRGLAMLWILVTQLTDGVPANPKGKFYRVEEIPQERLVEHHRTILLPRASAKARELGWIAR